MVAAEADIVHPVDEAHLRRAERQADLGPCAPPGDAGRSRKRREVLVPRQEIAKIENVALVQGHDTRFRPRRFPVGWGSGPVTAAVSDVQVTALNNVSVLSGSPIASGNKLGVVTPVRAIVGRNGLVGGLPGGVGHGCGCN